MDKSYLVTRPEHDDTTFYLSKWCEETIDLAEEKGIKVFDLHKEKAVKDEFEGRINKLEPKLVVFNGHGDEFNVTGHKNAPIITEGKNEHLLKNKIVYAISCKSAKSLGIKTIEKGCMNYSGYNDDFIFLYEPENITKTLNDKTARLFLEHSSIFVKSILKGNSVYEAKQKAENNIKENIFKLVRSDSEDTNLVRFLWWDMKHFVSHGNLDVSL